MYSILRKLFFLLLFTQICFAQSKSKNQNGVQTAWVEHFGSEKVASFDLATSLSLDALGNLYVTGTSDGDILTIKYDANGDTAWTRQYNGPGSYDQWLPSTVITDHLGNVYVTGGSDTYFGDYLTIKYSAEGNILWSRTYNGPANAGDYATGIVVDTDLNVYVIGARTGIGSERQVQQLYTIKYNENGEVSWQSVIFSSTSSVRKPCIALSPDGNIVITEFATTIKLDRKDGSIYWHKYLVSKL